MGVRHEVMQGEGVSSLAFRHGLFPDTIWDHPENADLRSRREDPDALMPGDVLFIPDLVVKTVKAATGACHRFRWRGVPAVFEIQLFAGGSPQANQTFRLVAGGVTRSGETDGKGNLRVFVPPEVREGRLWVGQDSTPYILRFGELDPGAEVSGIQKRLQNLGYPITDPENRLGPATLAAIRAFQRRFGMAETDGIDDETRARIVAFHDEVSEFPPS